MANHMGTAKWVKGHGTMELAVGQSTMTVLQISLVARPLKADDRRDDVSGFLTDWTLLVIDA